MDWFLYENGLRHESVKQIKTKYSLHVIQEPVRVKSPWDFPLYNGHADTKNPLFKKQLMCFNVYIAGCYFHIWFIL